MLGLEEQAWEQSTKGLVLMLRNLGVYSVDHCGSQTSINILLPNSQGYLSMGWTGGGVSYQRPVSRGQGCCLWNCMMTVEEPQPPERMSWLQMPIGFVWGTSCWWWEHWRRFREKGWDPISILGKITLAAPWKTNRIIVKSGGTKIR